MKQHNISAHHATKILETKQENSRQCEREPVTAAGARLFSVGMYPWHPRSPISVAEPHRLLGEGEYRREGPDPSHVEVRGHNPVVLEFTYAF